MTYEMAVIMLAGFGWVGWIAAAWGGSRCERLRWQLDLERARHAETAAHLSRTRDALAKTAGRAIAVQELSRERDEMLAELEALRGEQN